VVFILFGFVQITVNWTDGGININPLYFQLLGAGFSKGSPYAPVLISISIPVGAVMFLLRRKKWLTPSPPSEANLALQADR